MSGKTGLGSCPGHETHLAFHKPNNFYHRICLAICYDYAHALPISHHASMHGYVSRLGTVEPTSRWRVSVCSTHAPKSQYVPRLHDITIARPVCYAHAPKSRLRVSTVRRHVCTPGLPHSRHDCHSTPCSTRILPLSFCHYTWRCANVSRKGYPTAAGSEAMIAPDSNPGHSYNSRKLP